MRPFRRFEEIDERSRHLRDVRCDHEMLEEKPLYALLRGCINGCSLLIPKSCFEITGRFDQGLKTTQDYALWLKMIQQFEFVHLPEILVKYRIHAQQGSSLVPDTVKKEGNALWIDMMETLSDEEKTVYEVTPFQFYQKMAEHLSRSCYTEACRFAWSRAEKNLRISAANKKVSVIIPFFNRIPWTLEALQSVLDQTYRNFDVILVDDGSTEDISPLIQACGDDERIAYVRRDHGGAAAARNRGIAEAKGEYIAFLDSDDLYLPEKLEMQVAALELGTSYAMVYSRAFEFDSNSSEAVESRGGFFSGSIYPDLLFIRNNQITTPTVMVRADVLKEAGLFDESMVICEDLDLWRRIAKRHRILHIPKPLAKIRVQRDRFDLKNSMKARIQYYDKAFSEDEQLRLPLKMSLMAEIYSTYARTSLDYRRRGSGVVYRVIGKFYSLKGIYYGSFEKGRLIPNLFVRKVLGAFLTDGARFAGRIISLFKLNGKGMTQLLSQDEAMDKHGKA